MVRLPGRSSGGEPRPPGDHHRCSLIQELQSHKTVQLHIFGLVDHTHAAAAQLLDDAVVRDGLPDHCAEILGLEVGQVNEWRVVAGRLSTLEGTPNQGYSLLGIAKTLDTISRDCLSNPRAGSAGSHSSN
jgi:hypothetical protein